MATNELPKHIIRKFSRIVKNTTFVANQTASGIKTILLVKLEILINDNPSSVEKITSPSIYKGYMLDIIFWQHLNIFYNFTGFFIEVTLLNLK